MNSDNKLSPIGRLYSERKRAKSRLVSDTKALKYIIDNNLQSATSSDGADALGGIFKATPVTNGMELRKTTVLENNIKSCRELIIQLNNSINKEVTRITELNLKRTNNVICRKNRKAGEARNVRRIMLGILVILTFGAITIAGIE